MRPLSADSSLVPVFARRGPFVTVYLDASHGPEDGADVIDERWAAVRDQLDGADPDSLDAIEESLTADVLDADPHGRVAVAAEGELCLTVRVRTPPRNSVGYHTALPQLLPYLTARPPAVPNLVVSVATGRTRILRLENGELVPVGSQLAHARPGIETAPRAIAHEVSRLDPDLVLIAGDAASTDRLARELHSVLVPDVSVRSVGSGSDGDTAELRELVEQALRDFHAETEAELVQDVRRHLGDRDRVVTGFRQVAAALRMAQADVVLAVDGPELQRRCWVGSRPTEFGAQDADAAAVGVRSVKHDRTGSALLRAAFATGARFAMVDPDGWAPPHGVAALLR